jgi:hypothetical protein
MTINTVNLKDFKDTATKYENLAAGYSHNASIAYENGDFDQADKWTKASEAAYGNYNYFWGMHLNTLK